MAGNTGKMTADAIRARGPRMRLLSIYSGSRRIGFVVMRDPDSPVGRHPLSKAAGFPGVFASDLKEPAYRTYARSYSLGYLLRIGKTAGAEW